MVGQTEQQINAMPTKAFFVEMFTKDISLDQALLDLVDNSVDGAKRQSAGGAKYDGNKVDIVFNSKQFSIIDNCGGFSKEQAVNYAFRFGRPPKSQPTPHSIGQFGVGMKRALFKFGTEFTVASATSEEKWAVHVNAKVWEEDDNDWHFPWGGVPCEYDNITWPTGNRHKGHDIAPVCGFGIWHPIFREPDSFTYPIEAQIIHFVGIGDNGKREARVANRANNKGRRPAAT